MTMFKIPSIDDVRPIDFDNFKVNDGYYICQRDWPERIYRAAIGHFRKGIAIAHTSNFDCLVDVNCNIIFLPYPCNSFWGYTYETRPSIKLELNGKYVVTNYRDVSAPGKDSVYQPYHEYIEEDGTYNFSREKIHPNIPPYPMDVPYEVGKAIRFGNAFYHLDTLSLMCHFPNRNTFHIDSDFSDGYCDFHDELDMRLALVKVSSDGDIISIKDITDEKNIDTKNLEIDNNDGFNRLKQYWYSNINTNDLDMREIPMETISVEMNVELERLYNTYYSESKQYKLSEYTELNAWIHQNSNNDNWICFIPQNKIYGYVAILFCNNALIISFENTYFCKIYVFDKNGMQINKSSYGFLTRVEDSENLYPNHLIFRFGNQCSDMGGIIRINPMGEVQESFLDNKLGIDPYQIPREQIFEYYPKSLNNSIKIKPDISSYILMVRRYNCSQNNQDYEYFDILGDPLKVCSWDSELKIKAIIKGYLYQTINGFFKFNSDFNDLLNPIKHGNIVYCPTQRSKRLTEEKIKSMLHTKSPYLSNIYLCMKQDPDSNYKLFIFVFSPHGKLKANGEIIYSTSPNDIEI